ncbi:unnamed protein product [Pedinophyceae sp. YPF-701]|nr:unnamed protein product [Pedinophyceae sp. YPF-701]
MRSAALPVRRAAQAHAAPATPHGTALAPRATTACLACGRRPQPAPLGGRARPMWEARIAGGLRRGHRAHSSGNGAGRDDDGRRDGAERNGARNVDDLEEESRNIRHTHWATYRKELLERTRTLIYKSSEHELEVLFKLMRAYARTNFAFLTKRHRSRWWRSQAVDLRVPSPSKNDLSESPWALLRKVLSLGAIFFGASYNLTLLQNLKDSLVVTTGGAEVLPYLASFFVLPASIGFFMLYNKLLATVPHQRVFYLSIGALLTTYQVFCWILFPLHQKLHLYALGDFLRSALPAGLSGLATVLQNWTFSLFFCFAEIWGSVVISVLFWSLANEVCTIDEAKSIYPLMGITANLGVVAAGKFTKFTNRVLVPDGSIQGSMQWTITAITLCSVCMFAAKYYIDRRIPKPSGDSDSDGGKDESKEESEKDEGQGGSSMGQALQVLRNSSKVMGLGMVVLCYSISHRLFEFSWKGQLRELYPTSAAYQGALADVSIATGFTTIVMMFLGRFLFQMFGWGTAAATPPTMMFFFGTVFFVMSAAPRAVSEIAAQWSIPINAAAIGCQAGAVTQVFARASKFSLFDPAKEMVYIEMTKEEKLRGKAAVDLIGSTMGKSGASWIIQALLLVFGSLAASMPMVGVSFVAIVSTWLYAVQRLKVEMRETELARAREREERKRREAEERGEGAGGASSGGAESRPAPAV